MKDDFLNYMNLTALFMLGFTFAIQTFIGDFTLEFSSFQSTFLYMFKSTFGSNFIENGFYHY